MEAKLLRIPILLLAAMLTLAYALGLAGMAKAESTASFSLSADKSQVREGDNVIVALTGSGLTSLISFESALQYSQEYLEYIDMKVLIDSFAFETKKASGGFSIVSANFGYAPALSGSHKLAELRFKVKKAGNASIELVKVQFMNEADDNLLNWDKGDKITLSFPDSGGDTPEEPDSSGNEQSDKTEQSSQPSEPDDPAIVTVPVPILNEATKEAVTQADKKALDEAIKQADMDKGRKRIVIIVPEVAGAGSYVLKLPAEVLNIKDTKISFEISTSIAALLVPGDMLANAPPEEEYIGIRIGEGDKSRLPDAVQSAIGHRPVLELELMVGAEDVVWNNPKAPVTVMVDYTPTAEELRNPDKIVVWHVDSQGIIKSIPNGRYDPAIGKIVFKTSRFGIYAAAYVEKTFGDLAGVVWARQAVEAMAARDVLQGTAEETFSPQQSIKRGEFMFILIRALELEGLEEGEAWPFPDVEADAYYAEAVNAARLLGIAQGDGNVFRPDDAITREDAMVLISRSLNALDIVLAGTSTPLESFADQGEVVDYARESVSTLVQAGIVQGYDGAIHPKQPLNRAQAAALICRVLLP